MSLVAEAEPYQPDEVRRTTRTLEANQVGPEQSLEDLVAPRELLEQFRRRERDVQEEADPDVRTGAPQHRRYELQLVVLHPDGAAFGHRTGGGVRESLVDLDVG